MFRAAVDPRTMALLLCHDCFTWIEPRNDRCPDCECAVESSTPDPSTFELQETIGGIVNALGQVVVARRRVPNRGILYQTTNGLVFIPHQTEKITQMDDGGGGMAMAWTIAALIWSPLMLVLPFVRPKQPKIKQVQVAFPQVVTSDQSHRLAGMLMANPGVFFIPRRAVRALRRRRSAWLIERMHAVAVRIRPEQGSRLFHHRMRELSLSEPWRQDLAHR